MSIITIERVLVRSYPTSAASCADRVTLWSPLNDNGILAMQFMFNLLSIGKIAYLDDMPRSAIKSATYPQRWAPA